MTYQGTVQNGVVVFSNGVKLPDGTEVTVVPISAGANTLREGEKTIWQKMVDLAERAESQPCNLPNDLADNHDHYLHGVPKR
jgi:hypothetical protein